MNAGPYRQNGFRLRFEWGLSGAREIAERSWVVAVVDVLSFTTTLTVAADLGIEVFPYQWKDESAAGFARQHNAVLAVGRSQAQSGDVSLSPATAARLRSDDACGVAVVAAGEQWPNGALRPAVEDLWGAGAFLAALQRHGFDALSPEAQAAAAAFEYVSGDITKQLHASASGRELTAYGYRRDVEVAAESDRSETVPLLVDHSFRPG